MRCTKTDECLESTAMAAILRIADGTPSGRSLFGSPPGSFSSATMYVFRRMAWNLDGICALATCEKK